MTPRPTLRVTATDRVMVLAVHPNDESLATGGVLQRAVAAGAAVRVLFITDGENNPWPQRVLERRWQITPADRARWGQRRRREALAALARLGVPTADARFLGWPDQGLTRWLLGDQARDAGTALRSQVRDWRPTWLFVPAPEDLHPDHSALGVLVRLAFGQSPSGNPGCAPEVFHYLVHGNGCADARGVKLPLFVWEKHAKRVAISEHASQLLFSRRRFLSYATDEEWFASGGPCVHSIAPPGPRRSAATAVTFEWNLEAPLRAFERPSLHLVFAPSPDERGVTAWTLPVSGSTRATPVRRARDGTIVGEAEVRVARRRVFVRLPAGLPTPSPEVFVKLQRRRPTFLDDVGWRAVSLPFGLPLPALT